MENIKIRNNEKLWVTYKNNKGKIKYVITSKIADRSMYFLYLVDDIGKLKKITRNSNPNEFEKSINLD